MPTVGPRWPDGRHRCSLRALLRQAVVEPRRGLSDATNGRAVSLPPQGYFPTGMETPAGVSGLQRASRQVWHAREAVRAVSTQNFSPRGGRPAMGLAPATGQDSEGASCPKGPGAPGVGRWPPRRGVGGGCSRRYVSRERSVVELSDLACVLPLADLRKRFVSSCTDGGQMRTRRAFPAHMIWHASGTKQAREHW